MRPRLCWFALRDALVFNRLQQPRAVPRWQMRLRDGLCGGGLRDEHRTERTRLLDGLCSSMRVAMRDRRDRLAINGGKFFFGTWAH